MAISDGHYTYFVKLFKRNGTLPVNKSTILKLYIMGNFLAFSVVCWEKNNETNCCKKFYNTN